MSEAGYVGRASKLGVLVFTEHVLLDAVRLWQSWLPVRRADTPDTVQVGERCGPSHAALRRLEELIGL